MRLEEMTNSNSLNLALAIFSLMLIFCARQLDASIYVVSKTTDDAGSCTVDDCSLREAVIAANASPGLDNILLPAGTYILSIPGIGEDFSFTGDLDVRDEVEIAGEAPGLVTIVGDGTDRVMTISACEARLSNLIITGGNVPAPGAGLALIGSDVTIDSSSITGNHATGNTDGGGIFVGTSRLVLRNSTVSRNSAARTGGGIERLGLGPMGEAHLTLINTTISENTAFNGSAIDSENDGSLSIINSTIFNNHHNSDFGSSVHVTDRQDYSWANSIIIGRCGFQNAFAPDSNGGNLESPGNSCEFSHPSDQVNVADPGLGPLRDNGGPTRTHALLAGSPAIDSALDVNCPPTDQRGVDRPFDGDGDGTATCDSGAVELGSAYDVEIPTLDGLGLVMLTILLASVAVRSMSPASR